MELISIVVPVYNAENYLSQCVESLLLQTHHAIELILVNDGSVDSSLQICESFQAADSRVVVLSQANGGPSSARNYGIQHARGKYIAFVDSDDYCDKSFISKLYAACQKTHSDVAMCNFYTFSEDGIFHKSEYLPVDEVLEVKDDYSLFFYDLNLTIMKTVICKLFRLDIIKHNKIEFDENIRQGEDYLFFTSYIIHAKIVASIMSEYLYFYRKGNPSSLTNQEDCGSWPSQAYIIQATFDLLNEQNIEGKEKIYVNLIAYRFYSTITQIFMAELTIRDTREKVLEVLSDNFIEQLFSEFSLVEMKRSQRIPLYLLKLKLVNFVVIFYKSKRNVGLWLKSFKKY